MTADMDDLERRIAAGQAIAASYRALPQDAEEVAIAMASAIELTETEPW